MVSNISSKGFQVSTLLNLINESPDQSILISPISIYLALALTANGALNETQKVILNYLSKSNSKMNDINNENLKILKETICSDNKNTLSIGNAIFTKVKPTEEITGLASKYYNALISKLESKEQVDNYISEKTKGKIKEIVDSISNIDMLLINTVYFYSEWKYQFDPKNTFKGSFNLSNKSKKDVMFMYEKYLKKN